MFRFLRLSISSFIIFLFLCITVIAQTSKRVALVLGVSEYENTQTLKNPEKDAQGVAAALGLAGFDVTLALNVSQAEFGRRLQKFEKRLEGADAALFYFAGHGIQIGQKNYLLSSDAKVKNPHLIESDGIQLSRVLKLMEDKAEISMAFVDACRDNPLANQMRKKIGQAGRSLGLNRGLAPVNQSFSNSLVAFATAPGSIALDGKETNSPFTQALLKHLLEPNVEISTMLKRVTREVLKTTEGAQKPEVVTSMAQEFYFINPEITINNGTAESATKTDPEIQATALLTIARSMRSTKEQISALQLVRQQYPNTVSSKLAKLLIDEQIKKFNLSRDDVVVEKFDNSILSALDVEAALEEGRNRKVVKNTPEQIELALSLGKEDVKQIQTALNAMGYDLGTADGAFGKKSRDGLRRFQRTKHVEESGYLNRDTIDSIIETFQSAPKSYEGEWVLTIYRKWRVQDPDYPENKPGKLEVLAVVDLENRNSEFFIKSHLIRVVKPTEPFANFKASVDAKGNFNIQSDVSTMFPDANNRVAKERKMIGKIKIPKLFPLGKQVSADANNFQDDMKFHIKLHRKRG